MRKSAILLISVSLIMATISLSSWASAACATCGGDQDWAGSAQRFINGEPISDTPSALSNPQRVRLENKDFNSKLLSENKNGVSDTSTNSAAGSTLNLSLKDASAVPNPVSPGNPVMIAAEFVNNSSNYLISGSAYNVSAVIDNSDGLNVGKVTLERNSGDKYAGVWNSIATEGVYKATIIASASGATKTFKDAVEIDVSKAA